MPLELPRRPLPDASRGDAVTASAELTDYLATKLARHAEAAGGWRVRELAGLAVRFFPTRHLRLVGLTKANRAEALRRAANLARARTRETWEARHGIDASLWTHALAPVAGDAFEILLELWTTDDQYRRMIRTVQTELAERRRGS